MPGSSLALLCLRFHSTFYFLIVHFTGHLCRLFIFLFRFLFYIHNNQDEDRSEEGCCTGAGADRAGPVLRRRLPPQSLERLLGLLSRASSWAISDHRSPSRSPVQGPYGTTMRTRSSPLPGLQITENPVAHLPKRDPPPRPMY